MNKDKGIVSKAQDEFVEIKKKFKWIKNKSIMLNDFIQFTYIEWVVQVFFFNTKKEKLHRIFFFVEFFTFVIKEDKNHIIRLYVYSQKKKKNISLCNLGYKGLAYYICF